jgi:hypothetical protein
LRITGLRAQTGPGIELLEYLAPRDGRPAPADTRANDIWHWQTTLLTANSKAAAQQLRAARGQIVSPKLGKLPDKSLGFTKGFLARDLDGHSLQIIER